MSISQQKIISLKNSLIQLVQSKQYRKAEKLYIKHKKDSINDVDIWYLFAGINSERHKYSDIVICCDNIISLIPDHFQAHYNCGVAYQHLGDALQAITHFKTCIQIKPDYSAAYANCAYLYHQMGEIQNAVNFYEKSLRYGENPDVRIQLGKAQGELGNFAGAIDNYEITLRSNPANTKALFYLAQQHYENSNYPASEQYYLALLKINKHDTRVLNNLGRLYDETGNFGKAIECYNSAINADNSQAIVYLNLGKTYLKSGDLEKSEQAFKTSQELDPDYPETYFNLGKIYSDTGELEKAREFFTHAINMDIPESFAKAEEFIMAAKYFLASIDNPDEFNTDKQQFVADLFDGYADKFDDHLVNNLKYKTPEIIDNLLTKYSDIQNTNKATLDLGCGTGLCGHFLKPQCSKLVGIDISPKMIDKASELGLYDELVVGEIAEEVNQSDNLYDVIVAADVFVYIGGLDDIFSACSSKIQPDGVFIFSTEVMPEAYTDAYKLFDSGRHKHAVKYLDELAQKHGFRVLENVHCALRKELGNDVNGTISVLVKI